MAQTNLSFSEEEEQKISEFKDKWKLSKPEVIKKIIREFKDESSI